ncbi:MAG: hypothetical protein BWK76_08140 [Desulfobulbaceae bacterium A2]|nr:MAG: hypothetical protein BWK76_08140 [Desulfobulbaceae bacterium A2]
MSDSSSVQRSRQVLQLIAEDVTAACILFFPRPGQVAQPWVEWRGKQTGPLFFFTQQGRFQEFFGQVIGGAPVFHL